MSSFSSFDLGAFKELGNDAEYYMNMAKKAEDCERYEEMCEFMRIRVQEFPDTPLTTEGRNLLSVAYKNVIGARRSAWRAVSQEIEGYTDKPNLPVLQAYLSQIEDEIERISHVVLNMLETILEPNSKNDEERVFFLKMAGDYYRYLTESVFKEEYKQKTKSNYQSATDYAKTLPATHPIRLGLALNFSVCHYEILKEEQAACELAKNAFDMAIAELDNLSEADYKDSTLIMQLLRDNLTLWTSPQNEHGNDDLEVEEFED
jgi:tetratricopeptide (TPR) repeat protein